MTPTVLDRGPRTMNNGPHERPGSMDERFVDWRMCGRGATATVYQVWDRALGCNVAVKIIDTGNGAAHAQAALAVLRKEILISRSLRHPCICPVHEIYDGAWGIGVIMDFIDGIDLRTWMDRHRGQEAATAQQRLELLRNLADALCIAHSGVTGEGIVHRDLKPGNIMLVNGDIGAPVIMDFGCSAFADSREGMTGYTPKYMAPEQLEAFAADGVMVDHRADLFAFGVLSHELLTGLVPAHSLQDSVQTGIIPTIAPENAIPPSHHCPRLPPALDRLILQLLERNPDRRIRSAARLRAVLNDVTLISPEDLTSDSRPETITIAAHRFMLGSRRSGAGNRDELPGRSVEMSSFALDATPVTNRAFAAFLRQTGYPAPPLLDDPLFGRPDHPVVAVTHDLAQAYARWVGGALPTEAQWECAAKAGRETRYPWGDDADFEIRANIDTGTRATTPVRSFVAGRNPFGLWDMCGNVWEWCADVYDPRFYKTISAGACDPVNLDGDGARVLRGGSFDSFASEGRCAARASAPAEARRNDVGFRVAYGISE